MTTYSKPHTEIEKLSLSQNHNLMDFECYAQHNCLYRVMNEEYDRQFDRIKNDIIEEARKTFPGYAIVHNLMDDIAFPDDDDNVNTFSYYVKINHKEKRVYLTPYFFHDSKKLDQVYLDYAFFEKNEEIEDEYDDEEIDKLEKELLKILQANHGLYGKEILHEFNEKINQRINELQEKWKNNPEQYNKLLKMLGYTDVYEYEEKEEYDEEEKEDANDREEEEKINMKTSKTFFSQQYNAIYGSECWVYHSIYDENYINTTFKLLKHLEETHKDYKIDYDKYTAMRINDNGYLNSFFHILKFNMKEKCISVQPILNFIESDDDYVILLDEFGKETKQEKIDYINSMKNQDEEIDDEEEENEEEEFEKAFDLAEIEMLQVALLQEALISE